MASVGDSGRGVWASHGGFSCGARAPGRTGCLVVVAPRPQSTGSAVMGLVAPRHMGSSWIRDRTHVSCIGKQFCYHSAAREAPEGAFSTKVHPNLHIARKDKKRLDITGHPGNANENHSELPLHRQEWILSDPVVIEFKDGEPICVQKTVPCVEDH